MKRNLSESMAEVQIENLGQMGFRFQGEETREREREGEREKFDLGETRPQAWDFIE